ncbi:membrane protein insertase YidC [Sporosarcina saromensis]|uniref:Membrane protein insertase YidC n=1 Tax=Sporosarcina saromensis TaxID=359365 RepID=A0ABU4GDJ1_9BACL|nr:membrane protein insertase YidC [Sporosarcina saromensis]MDW0115054.1 membrane protein insertase YidC [Sporosarcina saromensis]
MNKKIKITLITLTFIFSAFYFKRILLALMEFTAIKFNYNYGLAIILVTLGIKLIMLIASFEFEISNKKRQILQPKFNVYFNQLKSNKDNNEVKDDIKQKIKDLESKYGINSFQGVGCLTLIIQLVIIICWYQVIRESTHIQQNKFLWIKLGGPDELLIFPVLIFITLLLNYYLNGVMNTRVKTLIYISLSIMIFIISLNLIGGVLLYLLTNILVTLIKDISLQIYCKKLIKNLDDSQVNISKIRKV